MAAIHPVVLSGGSGTRLWPLSRSLFPKQLLSIASDKSMLQATIARSCGAGFADPLVVGGEEHRFHIAEQLNQIGVGAARIILEPEGRNTAAAIALAAHAALADDPDAILLIMPSDHVIQDEKSFLAAVAVAYPAAQDGSLLTFGITPEHPETGYGYIEAGPVSSVHAGVYAISHFSEKPDAETARRYVEDGRHFWNSGIFLFGARSYLDELKVHAPDISANCEKAMRGAVLDGRFLRPDGASFLACQSISVDYAVMEKTDRAGVVPVAMGWSDVGSWDALWAISNKDGQGNAISGDVIAVDCSNSLLRTANGPAIAAVGVSDLVAVSTRDAVLIMPRSRAQDVKTLVDRLKEAGGTSHAVHSVVHRPWGTYETTDRGDRFQTKRIVVKPGGQLSLQMHHHRSEHWIVVSGTAKVTVDGHTSLLQENQSTYIPAGTVHRLENPGHIPLHLIEVQCGAYLDEDDIVRFEDSYGRLQASAAE